MFQWFQYIVLLFRLGLQYITEFQSKANSLGTICVCNLCEVKFSYKLIVSHVTAMKHRLQYMVRIAYAYAEIKGSISTPF